MDIRELLQKSVYFGLGLAAYSRDKIESLVEDMVRRGEVAQKDARQLAADLVKKGEEQREELRHLIRSEIAAALKEAGLATPARPAGEDRPAVE